MAERKEKVVNPPPAKEGVPQTGTSALAPSTFSTLATGAPAWLAEKMKGKAPRGLEVVETGDFIYPRLVLCQSMTPEVNRDNVRKAGDVMDNLTKELIMEQGTVASPNKLEFIPIVLSKSRFYWEDLDKGGGTLCRSMDALKPEPGGAGKDQGGEPAENCAECIYKQWDALKEGEKEADDNGAPKCTLIYSILGILPQFGNRVTVWSGKSTNVKVVKRFISICMQTGFDFWAHKFNLMVVNESSANFNYKNWAFEPHPDRWADQAQYEHCAKLFESLKGKNFVEKTKLDDMGPANAGTEVAPPF